MSAEVLAVVIGVVGAIIGSALTAGVFMERIRSLESREDERAENLKEWRALWREHRARLENRIRDMEMWRAGHDPKCDLSRDR